MVPKCELKVLPKFPTTYSAILKIGQNIWDMLEKGPYRASVVCRFEYGHFLHALYEPKPKRALYIKKFADSDLFSKVWGFEDHHSIFKKTPVMSDATRFGLILSDRIEFTLPI